MSKILYVGLDVHKETVSVSVAEDGREGEVRYIGVIPNTCDEITKLSKRLSKNDKELHFCYEASCCGYVIYRQLTELGHDCIVAAPTKIPRKPGDRVKTDRRDSQNLAVLHRAGDLTPVWVPDETHEAMRDLVRARLAAVSNLMSARQQLLAFMLRHGRQYETGKHWTRTHRLWLTRQVFAQTAHQIVFQDYLEAVWAATDRRDALTDRIASMIPEWSLGEFVEALRALRGIDMVSAATFVAAIGDISRFQHPQNLMSYLGLTPTEHSSGNKIWRGGITKTGNSEARRMLIEAAWSYRYPARVAQNKSDIVVKQPKKVRDIAWKAQTRLCPRYHRMLQRGKKSTVVCAAIARELAGFIWAIGQEVRPAV